MSEFHDLSNINFILQAISSPYGGNNKQDDFSELPPNQRKKKLQSKIEEITGKVK